MWQYNQTIPSDHLVHYGVKGRSGKKGAGLYYKDGELTEEGRRHYYGNGQRPSGINPKVQSSTKDQLQSLVSTSGSGNGKKARIQKKIEKQKKAIKELNQFAKENKKTDPTGANLAKAASEGTKEYVARLEKKKSAKVQRIKDKYSKKINTQKIALKDLDNYIKGEGKKDQAGSNLAKATKEGTKEYIARMQKKMNKKLSKYK